MSHSAERPLPGELKLRFVTGLAGLVNRLMTAWCRYRVVDSTYAARRQRGESVRCIYAAWHSYLWHGIAPLRNQGVCVMVSSHRDGEIIARLLAKQGFDLARGSSTRGGAQALRDFARAARERESDLIVTIDGPRGPARQAKTGVLYSASLTGLPIVPMGLAVDRAWTLRSWDKLVVGKPFARVAVTFGEELRVPPRLDREELETVHRARLEQAMGAAEEAARRALDRPGGGSG